MSVRRSIVLALTVAALAACQRTPAPAGKPAAAVKAAPASAATAAASADVALPTPELGSFRVVDVRLGKTVDAQQQVATVADHFGTADTIYASVLTTGTHPGLALSAKWTQADGTPIAVSQQALVADAPLAVAFRIANPDGWPVGAYRVEIAADGQVLASRAFEVR